MNDMTKLTTDVQSLCFALQETALYLDGHPNDTRALEYYDKISDQLAKAKAAYNADIGPITHTCPGITAGGKEWLWTSQPWPWQNDKLNEMRGGK